MRLVEKRGDRGQGTVGLGGDSGVCGWGFLFTTVERSIHSVRALKKYFLCAIHYGESELNQA